LFLAPQALAIGAFAAFRVGPTADFGRAMLSKVTSA